MAVMVGDKADGMDSFFFVWWFGTFFLFPYNYWEESSQLTNTVCFTWVGTTNQFIFQAFEITLPRAIRNLTSRPALENLETLTSQKKILQCLHVQFVFLKQMGNLRTRSAPWWYLYLHLP